MKKVLLVALFAAAGIAQAQVTAYGTLDTSVVYQSGSGLSASNLATATTIPSFVGIKGFEDLGGGNKVGFNLESQIDITSGALGSKMTGSTGTSEQNAYAPNSGTSTIFNQKANVQVDSNVGLFTVGRQPTAFFSAITKSDALDIASGSMAEVQAVMTSSGRYGVGTLTGQGGPMNPDGSVNSPNGVFASTYSDGFGYTTPTFNGLKGVFFYGFAPASAITGSNSWGPQSQKDYVLWYEQGPWTAQLGYTSVSDNTSSKLYSNILADIGYTYGKYTLKATHYSGSFGTCSQTTAGGNCQTKALSISSAGTVTAATYAAAGTAYGDDFNANALGLSVEVNARTRAAVQYTLVEDQINSANRFGMLTGYADYKFTKSTRAYVVASAVNNQGGANFSPIFAQPAQAPSTGTNITAIAVGLKTSF